MANPIYVMKQVLLVFFVVHTIFGLMVICGGTTILMIIPTISKFGLTTSALMTEAILFVVFGIVPILTVCFGCYGIFQESFCYLLAVSIILVIGWVLHCFCLMQYLLGSHNIMSNEQKAIVKDTLMQNNTSPDLELIQTQYECCGFDSAKDWKDYGYKRVPESCCYKKRLKDEKTNSDCMDHYKDKPFLYPVGCYEKVNANYRKRNRIITIALIVVVVIETMGVAFASSLTFLIRNRNMAEAPVT